jgi:hypothetical protein
VAGAEREAALAGMIVAMMAATAGCGFFLSKAYAGLTLFTQGVGIATLLGYPFRESNPAAAAPPVEPPRGIRGAEVVRRPLATRGRLR